MRLIPCLSIIYILLSFFSLSAQSSEKNYKIDRVDPPFWWTEMAEEEVELLVYGENIGECGVEMMAYDGVRLLAVQPVENPNYLFLSLRIEKGTQPGKLAFRFQPPAGAEASPPLPIPYTYPLARRDQSPTRNQGVTSEDFIYLLMPDRFANGNPENDIVEGMQQEIEPGAIYQRRGGDIAGIMEHLDYLKDLGVTTLWINPLLENDQPHESYHGYAFTDHYQIDPRFGSNADYKTLVDKCHQMGMKVIMDIVHNHVGDQHWFIKDLPERNWVHQFDEFTKTTYRAPTLMDPYASERDKRLMADGWFDTHMPDLNQDNDHLARYLTQNNLWWIEYAGIDGFRIDTYAYPDQDYMADWCKTIRTHYPRFTFFAETWVHGVPVQAWFTEKTGFKTGEDSHLPGVTDFQLHYALNDALTKDFGWTDGVARLYYTLAKDFVYEDPTRNVVFLDNHDISRYYSVVGEDFDKYKMGLAFLLTTRGIPCMYYGTEILLKNNFDWSNHEKVRQSFPGGFDDGQENKFVAGNRNKKEQAAFDYVRSLAQFRQQSSALKTGKLMQFVPEEGVYAYFRYDEKQTVMVIMNQNDKEMPIDMNRFAERTRGFSQAKDIAEGKVHQLEELKKVPAKTTLVLELL